MTEENGARVNCVALRPKMRECAKCHKMFDERGWRYKNCPPCLEKTRQWNVKYSEAKRKEKLATGEYSYSHICRECGQVYKTQKLMKKSRAKRCPECRKVMNEIHYEIRHIRYSFGLLAETEPEEAQKLKDEMEAIEGKEFAQMALDGILEKHQEMKPWLKKEG